MFVILLILLFWEGEWSRNSVVLNSASDRRAGNVQGFFWGSQAGGYPTVAPWKLFSSQLAPQIQERWESALNNLLGISSVLWDSEAASQGQGGALTSVFLWSINQRQSPACFFCSKVTRTCGVFTWSSVLKWSFLLYRAFKADLLEWKLWGKSL